MLWAWTLTYSHFLLWMDVFARTFNITSQIWMSKAEEKIKCRTNGGKKYKKQKEKSKLNKGTERVHFASIYHYTFATLDHFDGFLKHITLFVVHNWGHCSLPLKCCCWIFPSIYLTRIDSFVRLIFCLIFSHSVSVSWSFHAKQRWPTEKSFDWCNNNNKKLYGRNAPEMHSTTNASASSISLHSVLALWMDSDIYWNPLTFLLAMQFALFSLALCMDFLKFGAQVLSWPFAVIQLVFFQVFLTRLYFFVQTPLFVWALTFWCSAKNQCERLLQLVLLQPLGTKMGKIPIFRLLAKLRIQDFKQYIHLNLSDAKYRLKIM